jgi:hypothetical protein
LEQKEPFSTLKRMIGRKYSFQKLTQFLQGNNVVDAAGSNIDSFLGRGVCVLQLSRISLFGANRAYLTLKHLSCMKCSFEKLTQFSQGNNVLDAPASYTNVSLSRDTGVSSTQLNRPIWNNVSLSPP